MERTQDLRPSEKASAGTGQVNPAAVPTDAKDSAGIGQDAADQLKDKTSASQAHADKKSSLAVTGEQPMASSLGPHERGMPATTPETSQPTNLSDPSALQSDLFSASPLPATPTTLGDGMALPQADLQAIARPSSGAAEGLIQTQTSATPLAEVQAKQASPVDPSLVSRLVAWYAKTFKR